MRTRVDSVEEDGVELELFHRDDDDGWEVTAGGRPLLESGRHGPERALAELALHMWQGRDDISVLLGGLGSGAALRAVLDQPGVCRVDVVEMSSALIEWEARCFSATNRRATADPRVHVHHGELSAFLQAPRLPDLPADGWFAALLDLDEWPTWVSRPGNRLFYSDEGMRILEAALRPGGVLGIWMAEKDEELVRRFHRRLQSAGRVAVPVGEGLTYVLRGRRGPRKAN